GIGRDRLAGGNPGREAAVQYGDRVVPEPAEHPPEPGRIEPAAGVVSDHLRALADAEAREGSGSRGWRGQGMPAGRRRDRRGQIAREVGVVRAGDVPGLPGAKARGRIRELGTAVHDEQIGLAEAGGKCLDADQWTGGHGQLVWRCNPFGRRRILPAMELPPQGPLPVPTDAEREFWRRAVESERRRGSAPRDDADDDES